MRNSWSWVDVKGTVDNFCNHVRRRISKHPDKLLELRLIETLLPAIFSLSIEPFKALRFNSILSELGESNCTIVRISFSNSLTFRLNLPHNECRMPNVINSSNRNCHLNLI